MGLHDGHRERMRGKINTMGADGMTSEDILEMALYLSLPRGDTKAIAKALLRRFHSFSGVLNAPIEELLKVKGVGNKTAESLHIIPQLARYYLDDTNKSRKRIFDINSAYDHFKHKFIARTKECVAVILLNSRGKVMYNNVLWEGSVSQVGIYVRELVSLCIYYDADCAIIAHNHPSGNPAPSRGDVVATKELQIALEGINVSLEDHLIITESDYTSLRKSGWLTDLTAAANAYRRELLATAREVEEELGMER